MTIIKPVSFICLERSKKMSRTFESHANVKSELFNSDKNLKKAYDELAPRYELISKAIVQGLKVK